MTHDKLLPNLERKRRHLTSDSSCTRCGHLEESVIHIIRDCPSAAKVWEPGPPGWTTLNTDGSVQSHSGSAAARGLLRNEAGYCLSAFPFNLGKCSITRAELRGAIICLELAWEAGHRKVVAQVDYQVVISLL
ncbi:Putative ribonuclease H protein At1g65750 [Linum perenne]